MNRSLSLVLVMMLVACGKETPAPSTTAPSATATTMAAPTMTATATMAATATTAPSAAGAVNTAAYRGLKTDQTIGGYLRDPKDAGSCTVLMAKPGEKVSADDLKKIAEMTKAEIVASCPTDNIVGACSAMGMVEQYYGPKYTKETAKKACKGMWKE